MPYEVVIGFHDKLKYFAMCPAVNYVLFYNAKLIVNNTIVFAL